MHEKRQPPCHDKEKGVPQVYATYAAKWKSSWWYGRKMCKENSSDAPQYAIIILDGGQVLV